MPPRTSPRAVVTLLAAVVGLAAAPVIAANATAAPATNSINAAPTRLYDDTGSTVLPVKAIVQEKDNWCWLGTGLAVITYLGNAPSLTQTELCRQARKLPPTAECPDEAGTTKMLQSVARNYGMEPGRLVYKSVDFDVIKNNIDADQPLWLGLSWKSGGGHLLTISGYNEKKQEIYLIDPWPRSPRYSWTTFENYRKNDLFVWDETTYNMQREISLDDVVADQPSPRRDASTTPAAPAVSQPAAPAVSQPAARALSAAAEPAPRPAPPQPAAPSTSVWDAWQEVTSRRSLTTSNPMIASGQAQRLTPTDRDHASRRVAELISQVRASADAGPTAPAGTRLAARSTTAVVTPVADLAAQLTRRYVLNPDFVTGASSQPVRAAGYVQLARTAGGETAVVTYTDRQGVPQYTGVTSGDDEVRYALQAEGGTVFLEPATRAWFRVKDGRVTPLNEEARRAVPQVVSVEQYRTSVKTRQQRTAKARSTDVAPSP